jgi:hypothetical protein
MERESGSGRTSGLSPATWQYSNGTFTINTVNEQGITVKNAWDGTHLKLSLKDC